MKSGSSARKRETPHKTTCLSGFLCWVVNYRDTEELRILFQQFVEVCPSKLPPEMSGSRTCLPGVLTIFLKPRGLSLWVQVLTLNRVYEWQNQGDWTPGVEFCLMEARKHHSPEQDSRFKMTCVLLMEYSVMPEYQVLLTHAVLEWLPLLYFSLRL